MKRKFSMIILTLALALCSIVGLTACGHEHSYTTSVTAPTCTEQGYTTYSCSCGDSYFGDYVDALDHDFKDYIYNNDAKCEQDGTETAICDNGCGEKDTRTKANTALMHNWGSWVSNNNGTHTKTCSNDNTHKITENCNGGTATCQEKATCIDCGAFYGTIGNHNADTEWTQTETHHYHACLINGCTEKLDKEKHTFDKNKKCTVCEYVTTALMGTEITSDIYEIDGTNLSVKVPNGQSYFNFAETIEVADGATYKVYTDIGCREIDCIPSYAVNNLSIENNTYYILVTNDGYFPKTYTVTVRRRPMYDVTFNTDGGTSVQKQRVEEDSFVTEPTTIKTGYTFTGWDFDFSNPITSNTTITASWTAKTNTPYKVEYYLENLDNDKYTLTQTVNKTGTSDTTANAEIKTFAHFTHKESSTDSGNINANGTTVLKVYYTRDKYTVTFNGNGGTLVSGNASQTVKYGGSVAVPTFTKTGYSLAGFDKKLTNVSESFTANAEWQINQYTVTLVYGNGQTDKQITQDYNSTLGDVAQPEKNGYTFDGWDKAIPTKMPAQNTTINAKWLAIFEVSNGSITGLTSHGKTFTKIVIPETIDGVKITSIGNSAFYNCDSLTSVVIGNSVQSIGEDAFEDCDSLTSVVIGDSVTSIGSYAFFGCSSLTKVNYLGTIDQWAQISFGSSVSNPIYLYINDVLQTEVTINAETINAYAFYGCSSLTSVVIGDSVTSIGYYAFFGCSSLTKVNYLGTIDQWAQIEFYDADSNPLCYAENLYINNELVTEAKLTMATKIGSYAFSWCDSLTSIEIPKGVTSIGDCAFYNCDSLTSVVMGDSVTSIGNATFSNCDSLTSVVMGDSVTSIGNATFSNCDSLTSVVIGDNVTSIGDSAFYWCDSLTSIEIPNSVTSIGEDAFRVCSSLTKVNYTGTIDQWAEIAFGNEYAKPIYVYINNQLVTEAKLTTATKINAYAFYGCSSLTSVIIPNSVTSIGDEAFYKCDSLTSIEIPNSVTSIGEDAFRVCSSLTIYCVATSQPSDWSSNWNYSNCPVVWNCKNNEVANDGCIYAVIDGIRYALKDGVATVVEQPRNITIANIPSSITYKNVPYSVTSIGDRAFSNCDSLTSVVIGDNVTSIGIEAFSGCDSLTSVVIGNGVTSIGGDAFSSCYKLVEVINKSPSITVTKGENENGDVGYYALAVFNSGDTYENKFTNDNGYIIYADGEEKILVRYKGIETDLVLPSYITNIYQYAFSNCDSLTSVVIGDNVTSIGRNAFYWCDSLTSVVIGNSVTSIGYNAFFSCDSLTSIVIPDSVTSIGIEAFSSCDSLTSIKYRGSQTQWSAITKGSLWNYNTGNYTITYNYTDE